jgi:hypothetical protein
VVALARRSTEKPSMLTVNEQSVEVAAGPAPWIEANV